MNIKEFMGVLPGEKPLDRLVTDGGFCGIFRRIAVIGDSLSSGEFESVKEDGTHVYHDMYEYSWGQYIGRSCGSTVYNFSKGGMTAKAYMEEFADKFDLWNRDKLCQAYIIALGVNDIHGQKMEIGTIDDVCKEDYTKNAPTFAGYCAQIIQKMKALQPRAKFFLVTEPSDGNPEGRDEKRKQVRDLLEQFTQYFDRTYLIDLFTYAPANDDAYRDVFRLGHLTATGYILTARMVESYIDYIIRQNPKDFSQVGFIGTDLYYEPEEPFYWEK